MVVVTLKPAIGAGGEQGSQMRTRQSLRMCMCIRIKWAQQRTNSLKQGRLIPVSRPMAPTQMILHQKGGEDRTDRNAARVGGVQINKLKNSNREPRRGIFPNSLWPIIIFLPVSVHHYDLSNACPRIQKAERRCPIYKS